MSNHFSLESDNAVIILKDMITSLERNPDSNFMIDFDERVILISELDRPGGGGFAHYRLGYDSKNDAINLTTRDRLPSNG